MSRMDLLGKNAAIMRSVVDQVVPGRPDAILIVVSNPLDEMTFLAAEVSGFPKERVMGMAGVLDSARLRSFIAEELGGLAGVVEAMTLGSHGDAMVALPRHATVDGTPLPRAVDEATLERLFQRTRDGGAEIVGLLKRERLLRAERVGRRDGRGDRADANEVLPSAPGPPASTGSPTSTWACRRGSARRVEEIVELDLNEDELAKLRAAAEGIRAKCADLEEL